MTIPLVDLVSQMREIADDLAPDLERVLSTAAFIGGPDVARFEEEYAQFVGVEHCVSLANGTDAVELALRAVDVSGGEVIVPANTFIATAEAVVRAGGTPVLADVDDDSFLIDPERVAAALGPRTRAVVPVHLYGQLAPVEQVLEVLDGSSVAVVEDGAQSQGALRQGRSSGAWGAIGATSFYPGKNLGAAGDAGAVTTDDPDLARTVRLLGAHGSERKYEHEILGFNSRLDTVQAVVLRHKLRRLAQWNKARRRAAERYLELLADVEGVRLPVVAEGNEHVWHLFVVRVDDRDAVLARLHEAGVGAGIHYPVPVHLTGAFASLGHTRGDFPVAEAMAESVLSLPLHPHLDDADQDRVVQALREAVER